MKNPQLRIKKKAKIKALRKLKMAVSEVVHNCLIDIQPYITNDIMKVLKKQGMIYAKKQKKNYKTKKK